MALRLRQRLTRRSRSDEQRGRQLQHPGRHRSGHSPPQAPLDADRLPLGAAQAHLPEAHLPRAGAGGHPAAVLRRLPERAPAPRSRRGQHLRRPDHPVGAGHAGADAAVPVRLHAAPGRRPGRGGRRRRRGRQRDLEDDPHALGQPRPGVRREGPRGDDLRHDRRVPVGRGGDRRGRRLVGLSPREDLLGNRRLGTRSPAARVRRPTRST